ncbi:MAG: DUF1700 domain-containing protein [Erysipelotrichales bacterium]|nr:DUF1700 domain-containing protein [Erysipelotrichales bacterium]
MDYRNLYFDKLKYELRYLPRSDVKTIIAHYRNLYDEKLDSGIDDEEIYNSMPEPAKILADFCRENKVDPVAFGRWKKIFLGVLFVSLALFLVFFLTLLAILFVREMINLTIIIFNIREVLSGLFLLFYIIFYLMILILAVELFLVLARKLIEKSQHFFEFPPKYNYDKITIFTILRKLKIKPKGLEKFIYVFVGLMVIIYFSANFTEGTYIHDSRRNITRESYSRTLEADFDNILVRSRDITLEIIESNETRFEYHFTFNNDLEFSIVDGVLILDFSERRRNDLFFLLPEPDARMILYLAQPVKRVEIESDLMTFQMHDSIVEELVISGRNFEVFLEDMEISYIDLKSVRLTAEIKNLINGEFQLESQAGLIRIEESEFNNFVVKGTQIQMIVEESHIKDIDIDVSRGVFVLNKVTGENILFNGQGTGFRLTEGDFKDITLNVSNAHIDLIRISAENITANQPSGHMLVQEANIDYLKVEKEFGNLWIDQSEINDFEANLGANALSIFESSFYRAEVDKGAGNIWFEDVEVKESFSIKGFNGTFSFINFFGNEIILELAFGTLIFDNEPGLDIYRLTLRNGLIEYRTFNVNVITDIIEE